MNWAPQQSSVYERSLRRSIWRAGGPLHSTKYLHSHKSQPCCQNIFRLQVSTCLNCVQNTFVRVGNHLNEGESLASSLQDGSPGFRAPALSCRREHFQVQHCIRLAGDVHTSHSGLSGTVVVIKNTKGPHGCRTLDKPHIRSLPLMDSRLCRGH